MIGARMCQRSQEALISLPLLQRYPPFQLAPQFTSEQHIRGNKEACVAVYCAIASIVMDHSSDLLLPCQPLFVLPASITTTIQKVFEKIELPVSFGEKNTLPLPLTLENY